MQIGLFPTRQNSVSLITRAQAVATYHTVASMHHGLDWHVGKRRLFNRNHASLCEIADLPEMGHQPQDISSLRRETLWCESRHEFGHPRFLVQANPGHSSMR
jgi:hypothetical protein